MRVLQREGHHGRAQADPAGALGDRGQERERGRQPSRGDIEVVLGHPAGVEAELFGGHEQLNVVAVELAGLGRPVQMGEEPEAQRRGHEGPLSGR